MAFSIAAILIVMGVALFVAAPLSGGLRGRAQRSSEDVERDSWEHEHALALQGLRELEFDREMGKLSVADYQSLRAPLEARALRAMSAMEKVQEQERAAGLAAVTVRPKLREAAAIANEIAAMSKRQPAVSEPSAAPLNSPRAIAAEIAAGRRVRFCPQCGTRAPIAGNFCGECGIALRGQRLTTRAS